MKWGKKTKELSVQRWSRRRGNRKGEWFLSSSRCFLKVNKEITGTFFFHTPHYQYELHPRQLLTNFKQNKLTRVVQGQHTPVVRVYHLVKSCSFHCLWILHSAFPLWGYFMSLGGWWSLVICSRNKTSDEMSLKGLWRWRAKPAVVLCSLFRITPQRHGSSPRLMRGTAGVADGQSRTHPGHLREMERSDELEYIQACVYDECALSDWRYTSG